MGLLLPAHAGVIPIHAHVDTYNITSPRTRGGDPQLLDAIVQQLYFSPHTRG